jgi:hypothetical protein
MKRLLLFFLLALTPVLKAQAQVGIGIANPTAGLHVADSSVVFSASGPADFKGTLPVTGEGRRFLWYPGKAAFRSGYVEGANWDNDSIGNLSIAAGYNPIATGTVAVAIGDQVQSKGYASLAMGRLTSASGETSTAMGFQTSASARGATALGVGTKASRLYATSTGYLTEASGVASMSLGYQSQATSNYAVAMGNTSVASGAASVAAGRLANATGSASMAFGDNTTATGSASVALGFGTQTFSSFETVVGRYYQTYTPVNLNGWNLNDRLFSVGNGASSSERSNAMTILKNGNTGLGINDPLQKLAVRGNIRFQGFDGSDTLSSWTNLTIRADDDNSGTEALKFVTGTSERMRIDGAGNVGIGTTNASEKLEVSGNIKADGVRLATAGGAASSLNHYEESNLSLQLYFAAVTSNYSIKIVRVGKLVTITFPEDKKSSSIGPGGISFSTIPARFRSSINQHLPIRTLAGAKSQMGILLVKSDGTISIFPDAAGSNWTNEAGGFYATSINYIVD